MSTAKQITERKQPNLEILTSSNVDARQPDRKWFRNVAKLFLRADSDLDLESWHAIERKRGISKSENLRRGTRYQTFDRF